MRICEARNDHELLVALREENGDNPWIGCRSAWNGIRDDYILPEDRDSFAAWNNSVRDPRHKLRADILPQPFVGNPSAPVWVLMRNPGLAALDYYDLVSVDNYDEYRHDLDADSWGNISDQYLQHRESLADRRECVLRQFSFDRQREEEFYLLKDIFNTYTDVHGNVQGGYQWYKRYFLCHGGLLAHRMIADGIQSEILTVSRSVFVLDYCPYRSHSYPKETEVPPVNFRHHRLWAALVGYALQHGKFIVARGKDILQKVRAVSLEDYNGAVRERKVAKFIGKSAYLSRGNLSFPMEDSFDPFRI